MDEKSRKELEKRVKDLEKLIDLVGIDEAVRIINNSLEKLGVTIRLAPKNLEKKDGQAN